MSNMKAYKRVAPATATYDVEQTSSASEAYAILLEDERRESSIIQAMSVAEAVAEVERATANPASHNAQVLRLVTKDSQIPLPPEGLGTWEGSQVKPCRPSRRRRQSFASMVEEQFAQSMILQSEAIGLSSSIFRRRGAMAAPTRNERVNDADDELDLVFRLDEGAAPVMLESNSEEEITGEVDDEDIEEEDTDRELDELTVRRESPLEAAGRDAIREAPTLPAPPMAETFCPYQESAGANMGIAIARSSYFNASPPEAHTDMGGGRFGGYGHLLLLAASLTIFAMALIFVALVRSGVFAPLG